MKTPKVEKTEIVNITTKWEEDTDFVIEMLQDVQEKYNYLPEEAVHFISEQVDVPMTRLYSLATFYKAFSLEPRGEHPISVCMGTACHVKGGQRILERLERELGVKEGDTTDDLKFSLDAVRCLGCCGLAPVITIGDDLYGKVNQNKIPGILGEYD